jgi:hypothetical protein
MEKKSKGKEMIKVIDNKIIVPECKRILQLMSGIDNKTAKRDVKIIALEIANTTRAWLHADGSLNTFVTYLCLSPNGDRYNMLTVISDLRARLQKIIDDPSEFGRLPWDSQKSHNTCAGACNACDTNKPISHVHVKSEEQEINQKIHDAMNRKYSQNLEDWE